MKKRMYKITGVLLISIATFASCTKNFNKINNDPVNVEDVLPEKLLAPALVNTVSPLMMRNRNFNNELMQVTVTISDNDAAVFRYEYRNTVADYLWNALYPQLTNFKDICNKAKDPLTLNKSYQAISLICQSWIYSVLTDTYGDVPYFKSNLAKDSLITEPPFDSQKDIYLDIFKQLETANTLLNTSTPAVVTAASDPVFYGDLTKWRKFGNSLYLRLLLRVSGKSEVSAQVIAKIKEIVDTKASTYPKMTSNADNAILRWTGGVYVSPYQTIREQDWRSPSIGSFFIDHLRDWSDPRLSIPTYGTNSINRFAIAQGPNGFSGIASGYIPGQGEPKQSYFYSNTAKATLQTDPITGFIMTYPELQHILAECALKGYITTGTAQTYWETGVLNDITMWLPSWPNATADGPPATPPTIASQEFRDYLTNADIEWNDSETFDQKMERIHLQKYYSLFLEGMEQWFEYRRTGHPILPKGPGLHNGGVMPARMTYPVYVQSANPTSYKAAVAAQGPDEISTQVWWQKP